MEHRASVLVSIELLLDCSLHISLCITEKLTLIFRKSCESTSVIFLLKKAMLLLPVKILFLCFVHFLFLNGECVCMCA